MEVMCLVESISALTLNSPSMVLLNLSGPSILLPKMGAISLKFLLRMLSASDELPAIINTALCDIITNQPDARQLAHLMLPDQVALHYR